MTAPGNVLFVTLDQLRADCVAACAPGAPLAGAVATPALDQLAAEGCAFANHWTNAVPCGPARASLLTGLHAFTHRVVRNGAPLAAHHATLATEARRLGREPLLFGYADQAPDPTDLDPADPDLSTYEQPARGFREIVEMRFEAPMAWIGALRARGYALPEPLPERVADLLAPVAEGRPARPDDPTLYRAEDSDTAFLTDRTLEALEARREGTWFAHVAYIRPHPPLAAPAPWNRAVDPAAVPPPQAAAADHPFRRAWFSAPTQTGLFHGFDGDCAALDAGTVATLRAVYLGLLAEVDHHLGRLLAWLDERGLSERTLVVVTSDHGEMLGDQGMWGKESVFAPAHRVPLLIRDPRRPGGRVWAGATEAVDLAPTILDWLGGAAPPAMDGVSLLPALAGAAPGRDALALTEIDLAHPARPTRFQSAWGLEESRCNAAVLRDPRWTYVHFNGGVAPMLFDRAADPGEAVDLAPDPAAAGEIARLARLMLDRRMTRADRRLTGWTLGA
jgi:arylsulfatase A-like enzyme